ncbi:protein SUPPRESSOR OF PHYTOCHROME B 5-like [Zingiber officinale]|uniref:protein SUPPRESSOR OF PHYTOCHROME B 5-like n=1 Tax=Zingiber officinale TaxID=94328 RepID=UPI001C4CBE03|nr:protein SUPPRESSOR OF PHYTOCHROME B 5-like [Zingiber officinale]
MDQNNAIGDAEGCSSSESGWTEYISSPMNDRHSEEDGYGEEEEEEDDDDGGDSVASDASTGELLHQSQHPCRSGVDEDGQGGDDFDRTRDGEMEVSARKEDVCSSAHLDDK